MPKTTHNPPQLFNSLQYGFSQMTVASGSRTVYLSGQVAWDADQNITGPGDLGAQTRAALDNVAVALATVGGTLNDVTIMRLYIRQDQMHDTSGVSAALRAAFTAETAPATTWIGVTSLAREEFLIEVEAVAVLD